MKLKKFTIADCNCRDGIKPRIRVSKTGAIFFTKNLTKLLSLENGSRVFIFQDEENPTDWYLSKTTDNSGFLIRNRSVQSKAIYAQNVASKLLASLNRTGISTSFQVASVPVAENYYAIITRSAKS